MMKPWHVLPPDVERARALASEAGVHPVVAQLLLHRGIAEPDAVRRFLNPHLEECTSAEDLTDMGPAADMLAEAITQGEPICVHGDYDCDGVSATALLTAFLQDIGAPCFWYIPHRIDEGYGISMEGVEHAAQEGARLLVTVDCGTSSPREVARARELGLRVVVTDHHRIPEHHAAPEALVNPQREAGDHPLKRLSGAGVAWKLVDAVARRLGMDEDAALEYVDLATLGTVGDVVPLLGENRRLVSLGLQRMREDPRPGVAALIEAAGLKAAPSARDVAFRLVPPINASGRLAHADRAVALLLEQDPEAARQLADELVSLNAERRRIEAELTRQVREQVLAEARWQEDGCILAAGAGWHRGVVGIVASRLLDEFGVPVLVVSIEDEEARGSARSPMGIDLFAALTGCAPVLTHYGGHPRAGGFSLATRRLEDFRDALRVAFAAQAGQARPLRPVDLALPLSDVTVELAAALEALAPFGEANPEPLFAVHGARACYAETLKNQHVRFQLRQDRVVVKAIRFGTPEAPAPVPDGPVTVLAHLEVDTWAEPHRVQVRAVAVAQPRVVAMVRTPAQARELAGRFALACPAEVASLPPGELAVLCFSALRDDDPTLSDHVVRLLVPPPSLSHLDLPFYQRAQEVQYALEARTVAAEAAFYAAATITQERLHAVWRAARTVGEPVVVAAVQQQAGVSRLIAEAALRIFEEVGLLIDGRLQEGRRVDIKQSPTWQRMQGLADQFAEVQATLTPPGVPGLGTGVNAKVGI
ncbi:MAG: single-stranded-DNA-specific exonuclease RecJ [Candidatus Xenobia bacterium]